MILIAFNSQTSNLKWNAKKVQFLPFCCSAVVLRRRITMTSDVRQIIGSHQPQQVIRANRPKRLVLLCVLFIIIFHAHFYAQHPYTLTHTHPPTQYTAGRLNVTMWQNKRKICACWILTKPITNYYYCYDGTVETSKGIEWNFGDFSHLFIAIDADFVLVCVREREWERKR